MSDKTSEDLVFERLTTPPIHNLFMTQIIERKSGNDDFRLYYALRFGPDITIKMFMYSQLNTEFSNLKFVGLSGSIPTFKNKKD